MEEFGPLVIGIFTTWLVQFSKKRGYNPKKTLVILSIIAATAYCGALQIAGPELLEKFTRWTVEVAAMAALIYNLFKGKAGLDRSSDLK